VPCNPFFIDEALDQIDWHAADLVSDRHRLITIGGDHTVAVSLLRDVNRVHGPIALIHFDARLDTWDTYFRASRTPGTIFRWAFEEGLRCICGTERTCRATMRRRNPGAKCSIWPMIASGTSPG
jgi:agmatinase